MILPLPPFSLWLRFISLILALLGFLPGALAQGLNFQEREALNPSEVLAVSSDLEAVTAFTSTFGIKFGFDPTPGEKLRNIKSDSIPAKMKEEISRFMANLIISFRAKELQAIIQEKSHPSLPPSLDRDAPAYQWLLTKAQSDSLPHVMDLANTIVQLSQDLSDEKTESLPAITSFAAHFDQTYPLVGSSHSWISLLEESGIKGLTARFNEYWDNNPKSSSALGDFSEVSPPDREAYHNFYLKTRLLPVFVSHIIAHSIRLQAKADQQAQQLWTRLTKWRESDNREQALTRLCGTWHWTIHNHQNHQDHKMTLSFAPSSQEIPNQPQPELIIMNGDTIYLRWSFPSGVQEDSLLLSNHDKRLEGTFINSRGPHGNISGKRLTSCPP